MDRGPVTYSKGREYVSVEEFAVRIGATRFNVNRKIELGILPVERFDGRKKRYIDWELGQKAWELRSQKLAKKTDSYVQANQKVSPPKVDTPSVPSLDIEKEKPRELEDLQNLDKNLLEDCTIDGVIDWDLAKKKIAALTYAHDLDVKKGKYIEKAEVQRWVIALAKIIENGLSTIPNRYSALLIAKMSEYSAKRTKKSLDLTDKEKTELRNAMTQIAPDIMLSIQNMINEWMPEGEETE